MYLDEHFYYTSIFEMTIPVAVRSEAWVCGRSLAGIVGSNTAEGMDVCLLLVLCCHVQVFELGWWLVWKSPTECGVSECDRESSIMRRDGPLRPLRYGKKKSVFDTSKCMAVFFCWRNSPPVGQGLLIHEVSRSHTTMHHNR